ncbi:unnamed protein product [Dibothriocephalus latus]|uniref:Reverse transcriptase domain-containing protein n=1 Tax=Dibothriocephalus latus TaxID=60516 RepID=A0A3P7LWX0_DIBLA|nr:unnamed protein product [Dibothriocephalus latus]
MDGLDCLKEHPCECCNQPECNAVNAKVKRSQVVSRCFNQRPSCLILFKRPYSDLSRARRLDVAKLRQPSNSEALSTEFRSRLTTRADREGTSKWSSLKTSVYGAAEKILGFTQGRRSDWISERTLQLSAETTRARSRNDASFRRLCRDKTSCEKYCSISLINVAARFFDIVLFMRFQSIRDSRTRSNQAAFCAGHGYSDQIFTLRRIPGFRYNYQQLTVVCFVNFATAFVSIYRESPWRIMKLDRVLTKLIAMIEAYYRSTTARVLVHNNLIQPFDIQSGVRQGCVLSPILVNYVINWIVGKALHEEELALRRQITYLDYADDIALLASSFGGPYAVLLRINEIAMSVCMSINSGKTKLFSSCIRDEEKAPLGINCHQLKEVDSLKYLGARLLPNG